MLVAAAILCLLSPGQKVDKPSLELYQRFWVIRKGDVVERLPLSRPEDEPKLSVLYRKSDDYVCWDERGLTVRSGKKSYSTRLPEIAVSLKAQPRDQIKETLELIKQGKRKKTADALAGSLRMGNMVYAVVRWNDSTDKPWLEALVSVDFTEKKPKPKFLGRFSGLSLADKPIDDRLFVLQDKLAMVTQDDRAWGIATYDPKEAKFDFLTLGDQLVEYQRQQAGKALFIEKSSYGTNIAGRVDLADGRRKTLAESHGRMKLVDEQDPPLLIVVGPHGHVVRNLTTGSEMPITNGTVIRRGKSGVVMWSPATTPKAASLLDPKKWSLQAVWAP